MVGKVYIIIADSPKRQQHWKDKELIDIGKVFLEGGRYDIEPTEVDWRAKNINVMAISPIRSAKQLSNTDHALLMISWIVSYNKNAIGQEGLGNV